MLLRTSAWPSERMSSSSDDGECCQGRPALRLKYRRAVGRQAPEFLPFCLRGPQREGTVGRQRELHAFEVAVIGQTENLGKGAWHCPGSYRASLCSDEVWNSSVSLADAGSLGRWRFGRRHDSPRSEVTPYTQWPRQRQWRPRRRGWPSTRQSEPASHRVAAGRPTRIARWPP